MPGKPAYVLKKGGGYYQDDGPGENPPEDLDSIPDAVPRIEPLHKFANNPYSVLGKDYVPFRQIGNYRMRGIASWYGRKFHGQKTSSGEAYDMYAMTAAHPLLPIPSYVRVSNPANGRTVVVRVNDRGPFHADRIIDLSYTAAWKLGLIGNGSGEVVVESIMPGDYLPPLASAAAPTPTPAPVNMAPVEDDPVRRLTEQASSRNDVGISFASSPLPAPVITTPARGVYLQLGAFGNADNAEAFRNHMSRELDGVVDTVAIFPAGNLNRVQVGPYASRAAAEAAATRIAAVLGARPSFFIR